MTLAEARARREEVKKLLREGKDPAVAGRAQKVAKAGAGTFRTVAAEWYARKMVAEGKSPSTLSRARWLLDMLLRPALATDQLQRSSHRNCWRCFAKLKPVAGTKQLPASGPQRAQFFGSALPPATVDETLRPIYAVLSRQGRGIPHAAVTDPKEIGELMRAIDRAQPDVIRMALRLLALTCARPTELIAARMV